MKTFRITPEEEITLARRWRDHADKTALDRLILGNQLLAHKTALQYANSLHLDEEEAEQEAIIGVMKAARRFDPERGVRFSTYAMPWIVKMVLKYARKALRGKGGIDAGVDIESIQAPAVDMDREIDAEAVLRQAEKLSPTKRRVFLGQLRGQSVDSIGQGLNLTWSRTRQIGYGAIRDLKRFTDEGTVQCTSSPST